MSQSAYPQSLESPASQDAKDGKDGTEPLQRDIPRALLEAIRESVIYTDLEGRILYWNAGATRTFGYSGGEMIGQTPALLYPDEDPERLGADLHDVMDGRDYTGEWRGRRKDGTEVWVDVTTTVVRGSRGEPVGFLGIGKDITQRKRTEGELDRARTDIQLIADAAPAYIAHVSADRRFRFVNQSYASRFGLTPDQVVGRYMWEVVGREAYASLRPYIEQVLAGTPIEFEIEIPYEEIGRHYMHCAYAPELGADGAVLGLIAVITDVTSRKRAELQLAEQEALLRTVFESLPIGLWVFDRQGKITYTNPATREIWGGAELLPPEGWGVYKAWWPDGRPLDQSENPILETLGSGHTRLNLEFEIETFTGERKSILASNVPLRAPDGEIVGAISLNVDVTERKRAEQALRASEQHLRALDRLEAVGRLAGGVAHEANNQMAVVLGMAAFVLRDASLSPSVRQDVTYIKEAAERTAAVSRQLLAFSRQQITQLEVLDVNDVVRGFEPVLRRTLGEDIVLRLRLGSGLGTIRADRGQLEQMLLNLALNSRDAMATGGSITVETLDVVLDDGFGARHSERVEPGRYVGIQFRDTGHGMDAATLSHVFEPFFTTKAVGRGTGLGLASVYGIIKQHDGYVYVDSAPGQGTTFHMYFPATDAATTARDGAEANGKVGRGESVLVVEDDQLVKMIMVRALEAAGFSVLAADNGAEALDLAAMEEQPLDAVVTDLAMPGMRGRDLAEQLEQMRPGVPVLFVSGHADAEMARRGLRDPGRPFLQKPFEPEVLAARIRELLDSRSRV